MTFFLSGQKIKENQLIVMVLVKNLSKNAMTFFLIIKTRRKVRTSQKVNSHSLEI